MNKIGYFLSSVVCCFAFTASGCGSAAIVDDPYYHNKDCDTASPVVPVVKCVEPDVCCNADISHCYGYELGVLCTDGFTCVHTATSSSSSSSGTTHIDLSNDPKNCGALGNVCVNDCMLLCGDEPSPLVCLNGKCHCDTCF